MSVSLFFPIHGNVHAKNVYQDTVLESRFDSRLCFINNTFFPFTKHKLRIIGNLGVLEKKKKVCPY